VTQLRVVLDTGVLGLAIHPSNEQEPSECKRWLRDLLRGGSSVYVPEIADYELRRELLRLDLRKSILRLDGLKTFFGYLPVTTPTMLKAAEFWALTRKRGQPTADDKALDADVILAAQAFLLGNEQSDVVVATTNVRHLERFVTARRWQDVA
jgi:predicted nucleic acid-binding protein